MITNYKQRKNEVLEQYRAFLDFKKELDDMMSAAGLSSPISKWEHSLNSLQRKACDIREDKFKLMVAGEAKAGKSTFINAYLGIEILPMDIKQCTSAIVEIVYGKELQLEAAYADGRKQTVTGDEEIHNFLKLNGAISDKYRDIPVATINYDLLVRYGQNGKKIRESEIENFINDKTVQAANIHNIENYAEKIRDYIVKEQGNWRSIITGIKVFYPFDNEDFKGIEIVDSPGVCARGGVSEITEKYIENADAIIFLKPVSGQALESRQFSEFLKDKTVERNKNSLFLVLTRAANVNQQDLERIREEAYNQFGTILPKDNIIAVDSKTELYSTIFQPGTVSEQMQKMNTEKTLDDFIKGIWFDAAGSEDEFFRLLNEKSNFAEIRNAMNTFGRKAHFLLLSDFLGRISEMYTRAINDVMDNAKMLKQKAEDPEMLARKIVDVKHEIEVIEEKMNSGLDVIVRQYTSEDGTIREEADEAMNDFVKQTNSISCDNDDSFDQLERQINKKIDQYKNLEARLRKNVISDFDRQLIKVSNTADIQYTSLQPDFSDDVFKEVISSTENKANETRSYTTGTCLKKTHTYSEYSRKKHYRIVLDDILKRLDDIKNDLVTHLVDFVNNVRKRYLRELANNADLKKQELDKIQVAKLRSEESLALADELNSVMIRLVKAQEKVDGIKGGIDNYVQ